MEDKMAADLSLEKAAKVGGFGLLIMTAVYLIADLLVFQKIVDLKNAASTISNIKSNEALFRIGICCPVIVILCDVVVAWALYIFLKPINKSISLLAAWFRLVYSVVFGVVLINYLNILQLLGGADYLSAVDSSQLQADVMLSLHKFSDGWAMGLVYFGLHIILLGYLTLKSNYIPKMLGIILVLAGLGYLVHNFGKFLAPS